MKKVLINAVCIIFFIGCVNQESGVKAEINTPDLKCENVELVLGKPESDELQIDAKQVLKLAIMHLNDSCYLFKDKTTLDVGYSSTLEESVKTSTFIAQENKSAKVIITLSFTSSVGTQQSKGISSLNVSDKKVLEIGREVMIHQEDKDALIKNAFEASWREARKMLHSLQNLSK